MPNKLILTLLGYALAAFGILGSLYAGYHHIKQVGYKEAETEYKLVIKEYEAQRDTKIAKIEELSGMLVAAANANNDATKNDVKAILAAVKTKPLVVVKNGECAPSQTFSDSILMINKRINQSIKESQK
jgi:hypothetical protein